MLLALTAAALAAVPVPAQPSTFGPAVTRLEATNAPSEPQPHGEEVLQLERLPDLRLTIDIAVGAKGPFRFLVDTAADRSAVSRQLATKLNLPAGRDAVLHSVSGASRVNTASLRGMQVATRTLPDVTAPLLDADHFGADGILGTDVLRSAMVRFDFRQRQLSISPSSRAKSAGSEPNTIVVEARRRSGRLIVTEAELDGQRLTVVLDTGSEVSVGNLALRRALERKGRLTGEKPMILGSVTGSTLPASYIMVQRLDVGGVMLEGLGIAFAEAHTFKAMGISDRPALLLGMNALQAFDSLTIDMQARKLRFVMPANGGRAGRFAENERRANGG
ncbi:putative aspartyl protease [Sphingomonas kaistensis]|uniref:Putative aspartyl protease n=1 Tax=Sphingomonas kaistensis TaxID=298708 RepID=A0A7X5Y8W7_9SPHN|nr:aspartyl protease family protein [Sphingomonas kaistensis]NJC05666.1 putative aspartyl protease [Sphingomonas kaistensis]